jgi:hypothetical protein
MPDRNRICYVGVLTVSRYGDTMRQFLSLALLLGLAGCASSGLGPTGTPTPEASQSVEPTPTSFQSPSLQPERTPSGGGSELTGTLGADSIEGGCGYLEAPDGTRYQVMYPDGWRLQLSPLQLISPEGEVVARGGDTVTVRGSEASDMVSICQIGPMFQASEVVSVD